MKKNTCNAPQHCKHLANESLSLCSVCASHLKVINLQRRVSKNQNVVKYEIFTDPIDGFVEII